MSVFPSPPQGAEIIISRCFANVFRIKSFSCFLVKVTTGEINYKNTAALLGTTLPCSVTAFCMETGESPGSRWVQQALKHLCLCTTLTKNHGLKCPFGFYSQTLDSQVTPTVPNPLLPHVRLRCLIIYLPPPAFCR